MNDLLTIRRRSRLRALFRVARGAASGIFVFFLFLFLYAFLYTGPILAAEATQEDPTASPVGVAFRWINFLLVAGGAAYLIAKHGGAFFHSNAQAIAASITEATAEKAAADRELRDVETKIGRVDQEVAQLREAARRDWEAEAERLRVSGRVEIEKIKQSARAELAAAERVAQQELTALAASMAVERAGALVIGGMNAEIRARILRSFLGEVSRARLEGA